MELPQSNTLLPVCSYTCTELLSLRTKTSLLSLSTVDRLKDLSIGYHLPRRHRSSGSVKRKKHNLHSFIVASFNAQSVKGNDMACKRCEISTFIKDNGVDLFFVTETWLSAQGDEAKTAELAPSGFDVKSFPRQSRSCGGGIATVCKSTLGSSITFKTSFDFTHTSFEVVQASITLQHNTLHFFCLYRPPPNRQNNLTDSMFTEQLTDLLDYVNSLPGLVCLVGDMNIHCDNPLQSLTKQTLSTLSLYGLVQVINKPTHRCSHITSITIGNAQIPFKQSVKNLGFTLDCHLTMNAHVSNIARTCYFELRRLAYIRRFLTRTATATLVSAFVLSRIDYCNSLLFGSTLDVTSHLQRIQNYAARVILRLPMSSRITIHLKSLNWLPVKVRNTYKIACLCYHCHSSTAPSYITDMLHK